MSNWQTMETAPRNGDLFQAYNHEQKYYYYTFWDVWVENWCLANPEPDFWLPLTLIDHNLIQKLPQESRLKRLAREAREQHRRGKTIPLDPKPVKSTSGELGELFEKLVSEVAQKVVQEFMAEFGGADSE